MPLDSDKKPAEAKVGATGTASAEAASKAKCKELHGSDIAAILQSQGPVVKAVLLRHHQPNGRASETKKPADGGRDLLEDLVEEVEIDTTPSRNHVNKVLGGSFTFLGQWPSEGTVAMVRKDYLAELPEGDLQQQSIKVLRKACNELEIDTAQMVEKSELVSALRKKQANAQPLNPHQLQPPLHDAIARGDILIMRVAETKEELDEDGSDDGQSKDPAEIEVMSNEEFFLNYTRDEYLQFAARTDVSAEEETDEQVEADEEVDHAEEEDDEAPEDGDDENDEDYEVEEELDKHSLLNIILGGVIQKFREDNGRGPNTEELLELRSAVASELEIEVVSAPAVPESEQTRKRPAPGASNGVSSKRVKFAAKCEEREFTDNEELEDEEEETDCAKEASEEANQPPAKPADDAELLSVPLKQAPLVSTAAHFVANEPDEQ